MNKLQIFVIVLTVPAIALNLQRKHAKSLSQHEKTKVPAPSPPTLPPACPDKTVPPVGEYVVYEGGVDAACADAEPGHKVSDSCCTAPGGFNAMKRSFPEMYRDANNGSFPELFPGVYIEIQCNSDNTFTKGDNCSSKSGSSCDLEFVMGVGCYKIPDVTGQTWFAKSEGCECQAPAPSPPALPTKESCNREWCDTRDAPWEKKCAWESLCKGCSECATTCPQWCTDHTLEWEVKLNWEACKHCGKTGKP
jgi:hypothetical protein